MVNNTHVYIYIYLMLVRRKETESRKLRKYESRQTKTKTPKTLKKKRTHTYRKKRKEREIDKQRVDNLKQLSDVKKSCFFALLLTRNLPLTRTRKRLAPAVLFFVHKVKVKRTNKQKRKPGGINKQQQYCKESEALIPASNTKKDKGKGEKTGNSTGKQKAKNSCST